MTDDMDAAVSNLKGHLQSIASWAEDNPEHSEPELISRITQTDLLEDLGYEELGRDYRVDKSTGGSAKRPDIRAIDRNTGEIVFVIETKRSERSEPLRDHRGQLENRYMFRLRADFGILMNGGELVFYERTGRRDAEERFSVELGSPDNEKLREIASELSRKLKTYNDLTTVTKYFEKYDAPESRLPLSRPESRSNFYDDFALRNKSSFRSLVKSVAELFEEMRDENDFTDSAYDFWLRSYAREVDIDDDSVPGWWEDIIDETPLSWTNTGVERFMFCLETSYALFSRLILAKASADADMPRIEFSSAFLDELQDIERGNDLPSSGWPLITKRVSDNMRRQLIEGVFEEDIFYWWTDDLEIYSSDLDRVWTESGRIGDVNERLTPFGNALRDIILSLQKYDFADLIDEPGDPLGDLYQNYFDRRTRKALGEFYTPQVTVDYMLDAVKYDGAGVQDSRFIDPACGSGTFVVTALRRYLENNQERAERNGWQRVIEELCSEFKIVGLDIHPFAVLMSQVQFMLVLIPAYKRALEEPGDFHAQRLPIFRTNSLEIIGQTSAEGWDEDTIPVPTRLPVKDDDGEEITVTLDFPRHSSVIDDELGIYGPEGYFVALHAVFDAVKEQAALAQQDQGEYGVPIDVLEEKMEEHFQALPGDRDLELLAEFFKEKIADDAISKIETLVTEYDDGRLVKSIEDNAMATLLKDTDHVMFDYVVANPPYVDNQGKEEVADQTESIDTYSTTDGNWDLYYPFMEKGIQWLSDDGRFVYITPDQYMRSKWGDDVRDIISSRTRIDQIVDFRDTPVFEGVLNYPCITVLEGDSEISDNHELDFVRVTSAPSEENDESEDGEEVSEETSSSEQVGEELLDNIRENVGSEYRDEYIETYSYPQAELDRDIWSIMPDDEQEVFDAMMERRTNKVRDITAEEGNFEGIRTGLNDVFVVELVNRELVLGDEDGSVKVRPTGSGDEPKWSKEYMVDAELLRPYLRGEEVGRWYLDSWSGRHVVLPYSINEGTFGNVEARLISEDRLKDEDEYRDTYEYLDTFREELAGRSSLNESDAWYAYSRKQSIAKFGQPKIMNTEVSGHPQFMVDEEGQWYAASAYGMRLTKNYQDRTGYVTALLNSDVLDFVLKQLSVVKDGNHAKYVTEYVKRLPVVLPDDEEEQTAIDELIDEINTRIRLATRVDGFPGAYRGEDMPVDPKSVTCDAGHRDIDPSINEIDENTYKVVIGVRKKEEPFVVNSEKKAEYVAATLQGRDVSQDDTVSVLVPQSSKVAGELLEQWESDKEELEEMRTIEEIQEEINEEVFELFFEESEEGYREVIDRFHSRFSTDP